MLGSKIAASCLLEGEAGRLALLEGCKARRPASPLIWLERTRPFWWHALKFLFEFTGLVWLEGFAAKPRKTQFTAVLILR